MSSRCIRVASLRRSATTSSVVWAEATPERHPVHGPAEVGACGPGLSYLAGGGVKPVGEVAVGGLGEFHGRERESVRADYAYRGRAAHGHILYGFDDQPVVRGLYPGLFGGQSALVEDANGVAPPDDRGYLIFCGVHGSFSHFVGVRDGPLAPNKKDFSA